MGTTDTYILSWPAEQPCHSLSPADSAAVTTDTLHSPLSWLTQWTEPCCSRKMQPLSRWSSHIVRRAEVTQLGLGVGLATW